MNEASQSWTLSWMRSSPLFLFSVQVATFHVSRLIQLIYLFYFLNRCFSISRNPRAFWFPHRVTVESLFIRSEKKSLLFPSWISIATEVDAIVKQQLDVHEGYSLVTTGHSLGGALSILAAVHLKENFKDT